MNNFSLILFYCLVFIPIYLLSQDIPILKNTINDNASILSKNEIEILDSLCESIYSDTIAQVAILIEKKLPPDASLFENLQLYATEIANVNGIGRKNINDGIFILVVTQERKISIVNGYLIGDIIPDSTSGRIIRKVISPKFKNGEYGVGLVEGIEEFKKEIVSRKKLIYPDNYD